jgi:hypothetical protein
VTIQIAKSRAKELVQATSAYFNVGATLTVGSTYYEVQSLDGVSYTGNNTTQVTATVVALATLDGEVVRGSAKQKVFTFTWNDSNQLVSIT